MGGKQVIHGGHCCHSPVCLLLAHVLALPSDYVGEHCMVPVSRVTTEKLSPPGSSMSATKGGGLVQGLASPFPQI